MTGYDIRGVLYPKVALDEGYQKISCLSKKTNHHTKEYTNEEGKIVIGKKVPPQRRREHRGAEPTNAALDGFLGTNAAEVVFALKIAGKVGCRIAQKNRR